MFCFIVKYCLPVSFIEILDSSYAWHCRRTVLLFSRNVTDAGIPSQTSQFVIAICCEEKHNRMMS